MEVNTTKDPESRYGVSYLAVSPVNFESDSQTEMFRKITKEMTATYQRKNQDYGDAFHKSVDKYGLIAALTRMSDKFNRIENLILNGGKSNYEGLRDSLLDLASYCVMSAIEIEPKEPIDFENVE